MGKQTDCDPEALHNGEEFLDAQEDHQRPEPARPDMPRSKRSRRCGC